MSEDIDLAPLTVLFGPNGTGKTTVLDALEQALLLSHDTGHGSRRSKPSGSAIAYVSLEDLDMPRSEDAHLLYEVLSSELGLGSKFLKEFEVEFGRAPTHNDLLILIRNKLIESGNHGTLEARTRVATFLTENAELAFGGLQGDFEFNWGLVCSTPLDSVQSSVDLFDTSLLGDHPNDSNEFDDALQDALDDGILVAIHDLARGNDGLITFSFGEHERRRSVTFSGNQPWYSSVPQDLFERVRLFPLRLEFEPDSLNSELEESIERLARVIASPIPDDKSVPWLMVNRPYDLFSQGFGRSALDALVPNPADRTGAAYREALALTSSTPRQVSHFDSEKDSLILSPFIREAAKRISRHVNAIAPKFLVRDSEIQIEIVDPSKWNANEPRVRVFVTNGENRIPLGHVGSGIGRWVSYSIRLACMDLLNGELSDEVFVTGVVSINGVHYAQDDSNLIATRISERPLHTKKLRVALLIDEPEAHLHPQAVTSVGEWLIEMSSHVSSIIVATHHPILFNLNSPRVAKNALLNGPLGSSCTTWDPASEDLVRRVAESVGLSAGELFMLSRYVLFVEGPHDLVMLEEFYGEPLRGSSVRVIPLHGAYNVSQLVTSEIVWQIGLPIGVLTDDTDQDRVRAGKHENHIEKLVDRMLRESVVAGRDIDAFGLSAEDILFYLDDEVTASFAHESFPGWQAARAAWKELDQPKTVTSNGSKFKKWITSTYGLPLDRDTVRSIARKCKERGRIPEELSGVIASVIAKTLE